MKRYDAARRERALELSGIEAHRGERTKGLCYLSARMFRKVLVANRGEIAVRVLRALRELDIRSVAVYSEADRDAMHVRFADEAYLIGEAAPASSYLNIDRIVETAVQAGAEAVHPGYGFLAENADFARAVGKAGLVFVGPGPEAIESMGDKIAARRVADTAKAPVVPGTLDPVTSIEEVEAFGSKHGYPIAIKAAFGGGGRGFRVIREPKDLKASVESAQSEARNAFGRDEIYVERYLAGARHVEAQIVADTHGTVLFIGERDCSLQRRHQKLVEETPSPAVSSAVREHIRHASVGIAREVGYVNAGTIEYLLDADREHFYFMEMNTRLQVEHPVTELVTGIDLVKLQLLVAAGERLPIRQDDIHPRGHAIECRINAEDPAKKFFPSPGFIGEYREPAGPGVRVDSGFGASSEIPRAYDSLIAKLVVWGADREEARRRMLRALDEYVIEGVRTTIPFHKLVLKDQRFVSGDYSTTFVEQELDLSPLAQPTSAKGTATREVSPTQEIGVEVDGKRFTVRIHGALPTASPGASAATRAAPPEAAARGRTGAGGAHDEVRAPMQGTIVRVAVKEGDTVKAGDLLCVLEAMKMENHISSPRDGTVTQINVAAGQNVETGSTLIAIE
jgi:acetyl-CoA/propionyl-CoA/long-chain acyl-CoA carboxylase, biotin carboxylase, biotin carboxyl carrier protein